jgi:hypothetical protein
VKDEVAAGNGVKVVLYSLVIVLVVAYINFFFGTILAYIILLLRKY